MLLAGNKRLGVVSNDLSDTKLNLAKTNLARHMVRVELVQGNMTTLDFEEESFSVVIGPYSLIHPPSEEQLEMIAKVSRWLEPDERFLVNFESEPIEGEVWGESVDETRCSVQNEPGREVMVQSLLQKAFGIQTEVRHRYEASGQTSSVWLIVWKSQL